MWWTSRIRYVQRPLFSIIWHYPPIFFCAHFLAVKNQEFLIVKFSFIRRKCHWQRPKNPESDIYFFFFFLWISEMWIYVFQWDSFACEWWVQHLAAVKRVPSTKKREEKQLNKGNIQLVIRIFIIRMNLLTIRRQCINIDDPYSDVHIEIK